MKEKEELPKIFKRIQKGPFKELRISRDKFKNNIFNSIREWYANDDNKFLPSNRGITFSYETIDDIIEGLTELKKYLEERYEEEPLSNSPKVP